MSADDFIEQLKSACRLESQEHVQLVIGALVKMEFATALEAPALIEQCFRSLHNIKGSSHAAEFYVIETICHPMEDIMAGAKSGKLTITADLVDLLLEGIGLVDRMLKEGDELLHKDAVDVCLLKLYSTLGKSATLPLPEGLLDVSQEGADAAADDEHHELGETAAAAAEGSSGVHKPTGEIVIAKAAEPAKPHQLETLKVAADKLERLLKQAEEMLSLKALAGQNNTDAWQLREKIEGFAKAWSKADVQVLEVKQLIESHMAAVKSPKEQLPWRTMRNIIEGFDGFIREVHLDVRALSNSLNEASHATASHINMLLDDTKSLLMISCSSLFAGFPLAVRQLSRQLDKEVELTIVGGEIEMDRRILGELKDPLIHLLRNSLDHGIETRSERLDAGKPAKGWLIVSAEQVDRMVEIRIQDDGRGIDGGKVKASAEKLGIISRDEATKMPPDEALRLIFRSALSTSPIITEISGRGLGLAIVEEKIQQLGGSIAVETEKGRGTTFILRLPLTIATFRVVLAQVSDMTFALPTASIDRVVRVEEKDIQAVEGTYTFLLNDSLIPLAALEDVLKLPPAFRTRGEKEDQLVTVAVVRAGSEHVGFIIDEILGEQEILVKSLGPLFSSAAGVLGVTVLGSGQLVPILNVSEMLKIYKKRRPTSGSRGAAKKGDKRLPADDPAMHQIRQPGEGMSVLIVDDMVTARMLMRNIFESAGFSVRTANNGMEALTALKEEPCDVVVTDVEMPFMDGFKLTESIRGNPDLNSLPVVIVTSLASREDRERGVAVGANAYFAKSNFDQAKLLEVVKNLA